MTLLEALKQSRAMWLWLYENPGKAKVEYLLEVHGSSYPTGVLNFCYICQYRIIDLEVGCPGNCPINWGNNKSYACESPGSPYLEWTEAESGSAEEHDAAGKIIDLHDAAIKECESC